MPVCGDDKIACEHVDHQSNIGNWWSNPTFNKICIHTQPIIFSVQSNTHNVIYNIFIIIQFKLPYLSLTPSINIVLFYRVYFHVEVSL